MEINIEKEWEEKSAVRHSVRRKEKEVHNGKH